MKMEFQYETLVKNSYFIWVKFSDVLLKNTNLKLLLMEKMSIDFAFERLYNSYVN